MKTEILNEIENVLKINDFNKRREKLENIKAIIIGQIKTAEDNVFWVMLLLSIALELREEPCAVLQEQQYYYKKYKGHWSAEERALWKIHYAGGLYEEHEYAKAQKLLNSIKVEHCHYLKDIMLGEMYLFDKKYRKAEICFRRAAILAKHSDGTERKKLALMLGTVFIINKKYRKALDVLEPFVGKWESEEDIKINLNIMAAYRKCNERGKAKAIKKYIKKQMDKIDESVGKAYLRDIRLRRKNLQIVEVCPYVCCVRHGHFPK